MTRNIKKLGLSPKVKLLALLFLSFEVQAKDFGVQGEVFVIGEPDMLEYIQTSLKEMEADGTLAVKQGEMKHKTEQYVQKPYAVANISHTEIPRTWEYDPAYTAEWDIRDQDGQLIHAKGSKHNPLESMPLSEKLLFIDGDEPKQVDWAIAQVKASPAKLILVKGEPFKLMKAHKLRVFFDQHGNLVNKLGIAQVPAMVSQKGVHLLVEEVKLRG